MNIRHIYDKVLVLDTIAGQRYQVTLQDGTVLGLPLSAEQDFRVLQSGDKVLIDAEKWAEGTGMVSVTVFRDDRFLSHFGIGGGCRLRSPAFEAEIRLSHIIADLEKDAAQREHQSKHGSPVSSMSEDMGEGMVATVLRNTVGKLRQVNAL